MQVHGAAAMASLVPQSAARVVDDGEEASIPCATPCDDAGRPSSKRRDTYQRSRRGCRFFDRMVAARRHEVLHTDLPLSCRYPRLLDLPRRLQTLWRAGQAERRSRPSTACLRCVVVAGSRPRLSTPTNTPLASRSEISPNVILPAASSARPDRSRSFHTAFPSDGFELGALEAHQIDERLADGRRQSAHREQGVDVRLGRAAARQLPARRELPHHRRVHAQGDVDDELFLEGELPLALREALHGAERRHHLGVGDTRLARAAEDYDMASVSDGHAFQVVHLEGLALPEGQPHPRELGGQSGRRRGCSAISRWSCSPRTTISPRPN